MDGKKSIQELTVAFDWALVEAGYSESRLTNFRTVIKQLLIFGAAQGIECYEAAFSRLLQYCEEERGLPVRKITVETLSPDLIEGYLNWLCEKQKNSASTRNQRLSAIKAFFKFTRRENPRYIYACERILQIPTKKCPTPVLQYLSYEEIKEMLGKPNPCTEKGFRDLLILCLLYDTGARVSELLDLTVGDIHFGRYARVQLTGKGNKSREVPLSAKTADLLESYIQRQNLSSPEKRTQQLILNSQGKSFTRAGITYILQKYAPDGHKKITPHILRHTKAMHLLQSGVNIVYIRDILGHVDIKTTETYARADTEMKRKALEQAYPTPVPKQGTWQSDSKLMDWLKSLSP